MASSAESTDHDLSRGDWQIALEQRTDLTAVRGSVRELADCVRRGADLRLFLDLGPYREDRFSGYQETLYFQQTYAGADDAVAGFMTHHHAFRFERKPAVQPYISLMKCDPSGHFSAVKWMLGDRTLDVSDLFPFPYELHRWIVCDRWRVVYEHDAQGNRIAGELEQLEDAVKTGRTIRVGVRQFFGLTEDDLSGPEHISFLSVMQPIIQDGHVLATCDIALSTWPTWPLTFQDGLRFLMVQPSTSGEVITYSVQPGNMPFKRSVPRRAMQWLVATTG
jgi:hypothetical protein